MITERDLPRERDQPHIHMTMIFFRTELRQLLKLASDANSLMTEHNEIDKRVLELYEGSRFLRVLKYQDIMAQEKRVLMDLWNKSKELRALRHRVFSGKLAREGRESELVGYLEIYIAASQHAVETLLNMLEDLGPRSSQKDLAARLHAEQYSEATDAYVAAGEKLAVFYQQLLDSPGQAA